jgi:cytochrome oxidase Cu insertion factor (SCO1/SenC/PrrC family)
MPKIFFTSIFLTALFVGTSSLLPAADQPSPPDPKIKVGDTAPDFTLRDQNGKETKLSDFHGKKSVVLAFYVFAFTGG